MGLQVVYSVWKMLAKEDRLLQYQADKQHSLLYISEIIDTDLSPQSEEPRLLTVIFKLALNLQILTHGGQPSN